jgi:hypothetical protein
MLALITDFFTWLETDWQLPVFTKELQRSSLPPQVALTKEFYTVEELVDLYGYSATRVREILQENGALPVILSTRGMAHTYRKQDLTPLVEQWNLKRLTQTLDSLWQHFFPPACEICVQCKQPYRDNDPFLRQLRCSIGLDIYLLRSAFGYFLLEVYRRGSVTAWWRDHRAGTWTKRTSSAWGIILIYLLDRRLIHLSFDELLQLTPILNKGYPGMTRLWRNRRPEEYHQFLEAMKATNYRQSKAKETALRIICLFILLKYGLNGVTELGRPLTSEEILQVCREHRLVTWHLGRGIFLPYPLTKDIRVGHVILDDIRWYFWHYAANHIQKSTEEHWYRGPCSWTIQAINTIEQTLAAPMFEQAKGIISRRPETERLVINPLRISYKGELADAGFDLLPSLVQEYLMDYITYCHQERHLELKTLALRAGRITQFFTWMRQQEKLANFPHWTRQYSKEVFRTYVSRACAEMKASSRRTFFITLATFFSTLHELGYPVPAGYHILYDLEKYDEGYPKDVPDEEVMDRVFRDGVCNLTYDVFSRLALTIQYYCGTRISEPLDLHLFCVLEDQSGHVFLLFPKGKSKQERPFPIVEPGIRHNSVSRANRAGVSLEHNMKLHGHQTIPMHLRYLHTYLEDTTDEVKRVFAVKRLREVRQALRFAPGQIVEGGVAYTISLENYLIVTLLRTLKRRTYGIWGGFWAGALAQQGVASPLSLEDEIVIPEDTYEHTVAQYWYEALGLAVSEVAFERVTQGKWQAHVPPFLDRQKIEGLVQLHLRIVQDSLGTALGMKLMKTDIME